ncbi:sugar isomerase domain-containing protein [Oerskovia turbata]|uniref:Sugar isomerase domain-containing protein n=1 Tax=Oerskovia turbata TaxID=1713 RepID=A0A4Q1KXX8_9CELL|nr:sugar isomerase domain-containing protein [Oerskovia turbata]RXR25075.1 sugar isomerase domain-containing protein [Oerskovia turbata]RXR35221.1 sugar isomerase domain-containing protein [Oerskovia turbata]TGJ96458.1 SIS domain-containing protein [Actinotalea fermentans ATCC 43279 = JCM 9966 = DSM 3133]
MTAAAPETSPGREYLAVTRDLIDRLVTDQWPSIAAAARAIADAVLAGRTVHAFGTGHSHILAEELYYRAGGLVGVRPILFEGFMLHASAPLSTALERLSGLAEAIVEDHGVETGDVVVVASNSGSNTTTTELVAAVQARGAVVVAVTSIAHATSGQARRPVLPRLHEAAEIVIDNGGAVGDAAVTVAGVDQKVGPTSTVVGAAALDAVVAEAVGLLAAAGVRPQVYASSNTVDGDAANSRLTVTG